MKKIFSTVLIGILGIFILVGCTGVKEVDISKYIEVSTNGYQGYGTLKINLNSEIYKDKEIFGESYSIDYSNLENYNIEIISDKSEMLSNDDVVNLTLKYDEELYKKDFKVKLVNKDKSEYTVSGLSKAFMKQSDLTNDDYAKLKNETYDKVKKYIDSTNKSDITYGEIEFIDGFIKNPITQIDVNGYQVPTLVYLYKVNKTTNYKYSSPVTKINYIFATVTGITLDNEGGLSSYIVEDINEYRDLQSYESDKLPDLESVKGDYLNTNDVLEKINISE